MYGNDPGQTQYKILQAAPGGYLVDFGDGQPVLVPESSLVDQGEVNPTPGMYEQRAQFGGGRTLASQPKLDEAAAYTEQMHQQYPGTEGGAPARGPTPPIAPGGPPPNGVITPEWIQANGGPANYQVPPGAQFDADPNGNGGQPARVYGPPTPPPEGGFSQRNSLSQSQSYSGIPDIGQRPELPDLSGYGQELRNADQLRTAASQKQQDALNEQAGLMDQRNAALAPLQREIPADVARQQQAMQAFDEVVNEHIQQENDRISQRMAAVPQENPGKIWSDLPAWQSALGLLSAVTGGMLAVTTGSGKNMGLEAIERAIQRDVEAQRTNIDSQWKKVAHDEQSLQAYRQWKSKERVNMLEEGMLRREALKFQLESEAGKYDNLSKQAELHGMAAGLETKNAQDHAELIQSIGKMALAHRGQVWDEYVQGEQLKQTSFSNSTGRMNAETARGGAVKPPLVVSDRTGLTAKPGTGSLTADGKELYIARSAEEKDKLDGLGTGAATQNNILQAMRTFLETDPSSWSADDRLRYANLASQYIQSGGEKLGRMTDKDAELLKTGAGGDPLKFRNALQSMGASVQAVNDTLEANRVKYEIAAQQVNRDIKVQLPPVDETFIQRFGPTTVRRTADTFQAAAIAAKAFEDQSSTGAMRRDDAISEVERAVRADKSITDIDIQAIDTLRAKLAALPPEGRGVPKMKSDGSIVMQDALIRVDKLRTEFMAQEAKRVKEVDADKARRKRVQELESYERDPFLADPSSNTIPSNKVPLFGD